MQTIESILNRKVGSIAGEKEKVGIAHFTMFSRVSETTDLKSQAPTTYLEDGSPSGDHIIKNPVVLTISGVVGDVYIEQSAFQAELNRANAIIGKTAEYLPSRTISQLQQINGAISSFRDQVRRIDRAATTAQSIKASLFGNVSESETPQKRFHDMINLIYDAKLPIAIKMSYKVHKQMVITSATFTEEAKSKEIHFTITAQELRYTQPVYSINELGNNPSDGVANQTGSTQDNGNQSGGQVNQSALSWLLGG